MIVLVPSLGILLFNIKFEKDCFIVEKFSSPLWGFFYLILVIDSDTVKIKGSRPLSGDSFI